YIETDMVQGIEEGRRAALLEFIPLKRFGKAEEVARVASFIASDNARYITGQVITIDGGLAM
ncbi:MAG: SDR family oxidoreductase, partial [Candidatus Omnitrophota bacterium]|nr:SDR family oxidoreductase [Candidatus Omnitrophota bacterium]